MTPCGYKPSSAFSSSIPSAQLSSSPRTHFNTTVRWISHSSITTLSRRTSEHCNTPAQDKDFPKTPAQAPPLPIQFLVTRALIAQALVTQSIILHHHNSVPPKRTPRSAVPRPRAQPHGHPRHPLNMPHPLPIRNKRIHPPPLHILRGTEIIIVLEPQQYLNNNAIPLDHEQGTI